MQISWSEAEGRATAALVKAGTREDVARSVARSLVLAEADGHGGHGLVRLSSYLQQVRTGKIDGRAHVETHRTSPSVIQVDAGNGFAYPALDAAVGALVDIAPDQGVALACIGRSGHSGAMGLVVERLARAGLIGLMFANTPAAIAPWGGKRPLYGTNPIACGFPDRDDPVVIDMSLSKVARGHILAAKRSGEPIPTGWALDAEGAPTTDPERALAGTMVPLGGAKGAALALMVEALVVGLTGANSAADASSFLDAAGPPPRTGQVVIAISPDSAGGKATAFERLFRTIDEEAGTRLPGGKRFAARRLAQQKGLAVETDWFENTL